MNRTKVIKILRALNYSIRAILCSRCSSSVTVDKLLILLQNRTRGHSELLSSESFYRLLLYTETLSQLLVKTVITV